MDSSNLCTIGDYTFTVRQIQSIPLGENVLDYMTRGGVVHLSSGEKNTVCSHNIGVRSKKLSHVNCIGCVGIVVRRIKRLQGIK